MDIFKNKKSELPRDVVRKINIYFPKEKENQMVKEKLEIIYKKDWNVGSDQLVRSILFLIRNESLLINQYEFISDPRDIIMKAENESKGIYNYFIDKLK